MLTYLSLALKWISNVTSDGHGAIVWNASIAFNTLEGKKMTVKVNSPNFTSVA